MASRRLPADESACWREAGLNGFVPCVSNDTTIAALAFGQRPHGEPLSSEDMALLGAVAAQAATAPRERAPVRSAERARPVRLERLRQFSDSVVESLSDGLVVVDPDDRVLRWNRRMEVLVGVARRAGAGARPVGSLRAGLSRHACARPGAMTRTARRCTGCRWTSARHARATVAPRQRRRSRRSRPSINSQAGWIIVIEDVTERANLEEQLRLSEKMAAIGLLAAGVAHEVNTPLTGISSFTQMLLDKSAPDDPRTQLLEKIEQQTFRAAKIVNEPAESGAAVERRDAGPSTSTRSSPTCCRCSSTSSETNRIQVRTAPGVDRPSSCAASSTSCSRCF